MLNINARRMTKEHPNLWKHIEIEELKQKEERVVSGLMSAAEAALSSKRAEFPYLLNWDDFIRGYRVSRAF